MAVEKKGTHFGDGVDGVRLLQLAGGTALLLLGLFCAWQTWLIGTQAGTTQHLRDQQKRVVAQLAAQIGGDLDLARQAVSAADAAIPATADPATQRTALAQAIGARLPQAAAVQVFSPGLDEVLHADYRSFGYARAAQLMAAQTGDAPKVATVDRGAGRQLSLVLPVGASGQLRGWAWIELPFTPLRRRFESIAPGRGRIELRQGDDRDSARLLSEGSGSFGGEGIIMPVPGSSLSVAGYLPAAFIVLPRSVLLAGLLALLGIASGLYLLRVFGRRPGQPVGESEELLVSDVVPRKREPAAPVAQPAQPPRTSPAEIDPSIFRAYDVRGVVGKTLTAEVARLLGQSIGTLMREKGLREIVVGRDGRLSGPELAGALSDGLRAAGIDVIDVGAVPTPVVYFAAYRFNTGSGVAVTGSHNPPDYNGFKIVVGGETLSEGAIQDLYRRIASGKLEDGGEGSLRQVDVVPDYIERITSDVQAERPLKVVVDCGNGIPGAVAPQVLEGTGCEVVPLYCEVDGNFPNHHPDPSDPHNLQDLIHAVRQTGADLGVAFDGDGDRLGVVTRDGEIIYPDRLLMLFARDVLSRQPGATIIYDVKCTGHLRGQILDAGGSPLMWRTGHSLIKAKMRETQAELAGEMSGHFFFKERWYGFDDGIYAGARLLEILAGDVEGRTPEEIFATLPKGVSTPELKIHMAEGEHYRFIEAFKQKADFGDATLVTIDGVRADWPDGWGLVRASNTTPVLVLRFDADSKAALKRIQDTFREQLFLVDPKLELPF